MGTLHLDTDAVSRLLKFGEVPIYLSADYLEMDKVPASEIEMMVAKDMAAKKLRRIQRAEERKDAKNVKTIQCRFYILKE